MSLRKPSCKGSSLLHKAKLLQSTSDESYLNLEGFWVWYVSPQKYYVIDIKSSHAFLEFTYTYVSGQRGNEFECGSTIGVVQALLDPSCPLRYYKTTVEDVILCCCPRNQNFIGTFSHFFTERGGVRYHFIEDEKYWR